MRDQRLVVYSGADEIAQSKVSTGARGHETPTGIFSVIQKERMHYSNLYNSAPMPFMQRITWSGVALHAGYLPGYAASHGCVRMPPDFARRLFEQTRLGARVVVTSGDVSPSAFSHARLAALTPASSAVAGMARPMHLGAPEEATERAVTDAKSADAKSADKPRSLLKRAQVELAERTIALEAAKAARSSAAQRLEDMLALLQQARDASNIARTEVAKSRAKLQRAESELASRERAAPAAASGEVDAARAGTPADQAVTAAREQLEMSRRELEDREETAREIADELDGAERARADASLASEDAVFRLKLADEAVKEARRDVQRRDQPITMLVSRKTGKLYVRQGFEPILEVPLQLEQPDQPVGTHVFTAASTQGAAEPVRWTAMTVPGFVPAERSDRNDPRRGGPAKPVAVQAVSAPTISANATAALDRLQLPADVIDQVADLMKPGSSLIITDQGLSPETGKFTDLIVQTR